MAARELSAKGQKITILEARNRIGGRICTTHEGAFSKPVELGAEFVQGNLPVTLGLLDNAGIAHRAAGGRM
jgi:monoamine oxidase